MKITHILGTLSLFIAFACKPTTYPNRYHLKIKGSESMLEAFEALKQDFEILQDTIEISIEGGGSRTGLMAIGENQVHIGLSSFKFNIDSIFGPDHEVIEHVIGYDGIVVITNPSNPLLRLTDQEISDIFSGRVSNWNEISGNNASVIPVFRNQNSGTQRFFTDYFRVDELPDRHIIAADNAEIVSYVNKNPGAIGFIGFTYFSEGTNSLLLESGSGVFVPPTFSNLWDNSYPLKRPLHMYYREGVDQGLRGFLDYLQTERAQTVLKGHGLLPLKKLLF